MIAPHPLSALSFDETNLARDLVKALHPGALLLFRSNYLWEPPKADVVKFLELEHSGTLQATSPRPARCSQVFYDVLGGNAPAHYHEAIVDLGKRKVVDDRVISSEHHHAALIMTEFEQVTEAVTNSPMVKEKLASIKLPEGFEVVVEPWPYGGPDERDGNTRFFQALMFGRDTRSGNADSNFYAYPLPFIPIMDAHLRKVIRIDEPATGGKGESLTAKTHDVGVIDHCQTSEYVPELLPNGTRKDLKPLTVVQPEGPSFSIKDSNRIEWQRWSMRVTFNPREGAVIHDIRYDGRPILYRLSMSDMTVPYADPRTPFHRKQAFDFGDGGLGNCVNNLTLGCDCLGVIKYFDGVLIDGNGDAQETKNVICLHEQDNGINWKHTNWRTGRAVVTRRRELVVQFIITLANYEYIFAYKFDQAAGITIEARATGIVSVVNIDKGKTNLWGKVVSPGALAQNHQHIFCARIDPSIDGHNNTVVQEESLPVEMNPVTNPNGNYYEVRQTPITRSAGVDANPFSNRVFKIQNTNKLNPITGKPVGYKIIPPPAQLLLADPNSIQSKRALFARHHLWVTKYNDHELFAGGRYTLQSRLEVGGVHDAAARNDNVQNEDLVLWSVFGLTHNPRIEDWPVMPVEMLTLSITPYDFFNGNPALDVPGDKDIGSKLTGGCCSTKVEDPPIKAAL